MCKIWSYIRLHTCVRGYIVHIFTNRAILSKQFFKIYIVFIYCDWDLIPEQFTVKAQESLFLTRLSVATSVCVQMAAAMEAIGPNASFFMQMSMGCNRPYINHVNVYRVIIGVYIVTNLHKGTFASRLCICGISFILSISVALAFSSTLQRFHANYLIMDELLYYDYCIGSGIARRK